MNATATKVLKGKEVQTASDRQQSSLITLNKVPITPASRGSRKNTIDNAVQTPPQEAQREEKIQQPNETDSIKLPFLPIDEDPRQLNNNSSMISQQENASMLQSKLQVDMNEQINKYFEECSLKIKEFQEYRNRFVLPTNHRIKKLIKNGEIDINDKCEQLNFKEKEKLKAKRLEAQRKMKEIEKYEIIRKLKGIEQEEIQLIHKSIKEQRNRSLQMKKIDYAAQDKEKMAELVKNNRQFEKSLQQKTELYNLSVQNMRKEQEEARKRQKEAENMKKKEEIAKKLRELSQKSQERKQLLKNSILKVNHQYIHKQLERKFKNVQRQGKKQTEQKLRQISQRHKLDIDKINEHDRKYTQHLEKRSQSLSSIKVQSTTSRKRQQTYFRKVIDEEIFEIKQKNYQKLMKVKENEYKTKIMKYQQKIDKQFKPKIDPSLVIPVIPRTYSSVTLTSHERFQKGLQYLALAKQRKKSIEDIIQPPKEVQNYGYKAYKDYLKQRQPKNIDATQKQLKQIMAKKGENDFSAIERAKYLSQGLQAKSKKGGDTMMYHSAKAKLSLLSQLY